MILLNIIAEPRQQYQYTLHHAKYYEAKIQRNDKNTFANKLNNYSREADIKQKEAFSTFYNDDYILYNFIIDVQLSWLNYNSITMTLKKSDIHL